MERTIKILWSDDQIPNVISKSNSVIVLVDTLRCSSTLAAALFHNANEVFLSKEIDRAFSLKNKYPKAILAGERGSVKVEGFEATNSPVFFSIQNNAEQVILSSGNFCNVLEKYIDLSDNILSATLVNAQATCHYITQKDFKEIYFISIGTYHMDGEYFSTPKHTSEDFWGAAYIARLLEKESNTNCSDIDEVRNILDSKEKLIKELQKSEYVSYLNRLDSLNSTNKNSKDMELCFTVDTFPVVTSLKDKSELKFIGIDSTNSNN